MDTAFVLGAGINRSVVGPDGLRPPLARDFFKQALRLPGLAHASVQAQLSPLLDFIQKYWRLDKNQLLTTDLDLEECYTFIELQRREAHFRQDVNARAEASRILYLLTGLLFEYLGECENWHYTAPTFGEFGQLIHRSRSAVLTFNYDTLLESAIERASPPNLDASQALMQRERTSHNSSTDEIQDDEVSYSFYTWNPFLAYKVHFDEVTLRTPGISRTVPGPRYYDFLNPLLTYGSI